MEARITPVDYMRLADERIAAIMDQDTSQVGVSGFRLLSIAEMRANLHPPDWTIKGYIENNSTSLLFGEPGHFKTFVANDMSLCVATSTDWHGCRTKQGLVIYVAGEGNSGLIRRIAAWEIEHGMNLDDAPFVASDRAIGVLDETGTIALIEEINRLIEQHGQPKLVVIDTLARCFGDGDENSTRDMGRFISSVDRAIRNRYGCAVLIIHHSGLADKNRSRGASALKAALDFEFQVVSIDEVVAITCKKSKDHKPPEPMYLSAWEVNLPGMFDEDGKQVTSIVLRDTERTISRTSKKKPLQGATKVAFDCLRKLMDQEGGEPVHVVTWREEAIRGGISPSEDRGSKLKAFNRAVTNLQNRGLVKGYKDLWGILPDDDSKTDNGH